MGKSFVLGALRILGLEEMLKLSNTYKVKQVPMKMAAGDEFASTNYAPTQTHDEASPQKEKEPEEGKILPFKKLSGEILEPVKESEPVKDQGAAPASEDGSFYSTEFMLWQRDLAKETHQPQAKQEAAKGYQKAAEKYVVKSIDQKGKERIRFVATNGVLINKKQA